MFKTISNDKNSRARTGIIKTNHGRIETPAYVIVGTYASVLYLEPEDILKTETQAIISNTYHLWRIFGEDTLSKFPGLHETMGWNGPIITDSGGFQVFSLGFLKNGYAGKEKVSGEAGKKEKSGNVIKITEGGVYFVDYNNANREEELYLDAEKSIKIQEQLDSDIMVAFDEPTSPTADYSYTKESMRRTHDWAERSLEAKRTDRKIYGVVQGGGFEDLRKESAKYIGSLPFDGFGIGSTYGNAYGGTNKKTKQILDWAIPYLPENKPRHLFGVGRINNILDGVEAGIDTFDCVIPTREARHGRLWTTYGYIDIKKSMFKYDDDVIDEDCRCPVCYDFKIKKSYLRELFKKDKEKARRLATIHNVYFFNDFMKRLRDAINNNNFKKFKEKMIEIYK